MKMALDGAVGVNIIKTYEPGRVQIRDRYFTRSLIVLPRPAVHRLAAGRRGHSARVHFEPISNTGPRC